ncbi:hypothetical protein A3F29_02495 [Candidatus Roizmanbacteria bacterium RIFCSPHIGHO2_12_FULL_33_9]|uniref:Uncharacterized protein n=1 Tax=Candidatus Roizmanbacteria bacterium RIFCSPHIGHO2_12_FULL_33_9 TaxID=1802045 RepID=A0A1F7HJ33_9BACT|nr:MAG: hypothetical protein A3F29_02495 [Candidatus Roizmanbacteria bacterium RIFCSPHIGHO2_12_FULL_33_9]
MRQKKNPDLIEDIVNFQKELIKNKPSHNIMYEQVRMMRYKIRPLQGDISELNFKNEKFIEILWNLGKLDEFFDKKKKLLDKRQKEIFYGFLDKIYDKLQHQLNHLDLKFSEADEKSSIIEMEILREMGKKRKLN